MKGSLCELGAEGPWQVCVIQCVAIIYVFEVIIGSGICV